jgi:hypothetical protein
MGTAGRTAPLRRTGSLLGLLGLELAAVLGLHWLGRFPGLRIGWDEPVPWLLSSPVQEVLGALLRTVALVMAYWLLASTVLYLLASLTRLPAAVRAVSWATIPVVRRVADHALAVTLATSMVGGGTLGAAGPALAADSRSGAGPPARKPVAAAQATTTTEPADPGYVPEVDGQPDDTTTTTAAADPRYTPPVDGQPDDTTAQATTTTTGATRTTEAPTTTKAPTTTEAPTTSEAPTTTEPPATSTTRAATTSTSRAAPLKPPAYEFDTAGRGAPPPTTSTASTTTTSSASTTTSTTRLRPPAYRFPAATPSEAEETPDDAGTGGGGSGGGGGEDRSGGREEEQQRTHTVERGDNLWTIARDHLRSDGSGEPTNHQVTEYWVQVKEANQGRLESGDPDIIETGETVILPPVLSSTAAPAPETRRQATRPAAPGDSLWTLARDHLTAVGNGEPSTRQVVEYWERVKEANRHRLRSGDPDVIEIGEPIILPPVD